MPGATPPNGYVDYYELLLKINFNDNVLALGNIAADYPLFTPEARQAGWNEAYTFYGASIGSPPYAATYAFIKARAALLGINFFIKSAVLHQASNFKSSFPLPLAAKVGCYDSGAIYTSTNSSQYCSAPEEAVMIRCECGNMRRYEHLIRGVKDGVVANAMTMFYPTSYADTATYAITSDVDTQAASTPLPALTGGTAATITVTNTNGVISSPTVAGGGGGNFPGVADGTYECWFANPGKGGSGGYGSITIASNAAIGVSINNGGTGYVGTTVYVLVGNDPNGLNNYLAPSLYWANFAQALIQFTGSGSMKRLPVSMFTGGTPQFPSGTAPVIIGAVQKCTRSMIQRVANRQTGVIRLTKSARKRRGIAAIKS